MLCLNYAFLLPYFFCSSTDFHSPRSTLTDTYGSEIFLAINHENDMSKMTNIYVSDMRGQQFQLTLLHSVRNLEGNVDFERLLGSQGSFISNVYDNQEIMRLRERGSQEKE